MDSGNESSLAIQQNLKTAAEGDVKEYVIQVVASHFGLTPRDQATLDLELTSSVSYLTEFISEADKNVLVVDRVVAREQGDQAAGAESGGEDTAPATFQVHDGLFVADRGQAMVFVKQSNVIEADKKIATQVAAFPLNGGSAWEQLHFVMSRILNPYCKSFISQSGRGERDGDKLAPTVQKCFTEAEAALLHLQQNIDIPEINLVVNPHILDAIEKARKENRHATMDDLREIVEDTNFLNALQAGCNRWVKEIRKVTQLERDPSSGSSLQEMTFWLNLERALLKIAQKRDGEEVTLTLEALKCGKRFHATVSFDSDTGLKQKLAVVQDYNTLMKDFPLSELVSASDVPKLTHAIAGIFLHLRKLRSTKYPLQRALRLVEAISRDLNSQLLKVLSSYSLMHVPIVEFNDIMSQCQALFSKWDDEYDKFIALLRDINKKKRDDPSKLSWKVTAVHKRLEQRLTQIFQFRKQHEQFRTVIERVLRPVGNSSSRSKEEFMVDSTEGEKSPDEQVDIAYEILKNVEFLDVDSPAWENAFKRYEDQIGVVETAITTRLKGQLESSRNSNEMFSIFSRYNALFIRPRIRGAIYEYQTRLINRVKDDINKLQERFTKARGEQGVKIMQTAGLPPFSAKIMWIRNFERQLQRYMKRVEDVLGKQWENHVDGRQLKADGDNFKVKLNTQPMFEDWVETVQSQNWVLPNKILTVDRVQVDGRMQLQLKVNYNLDSLVLYKEVSHLKTMGFRVPLKIVNWAHQANQMHPSATSLIEATRTFSSVNAALASVQGVDSLLASYKKDIQNQLLEGATLGWDSYKVDQYQLKLAETVNTYQERCEELLNVVRIVNADLNVLKSCRYDKETIENLLTSIQKGVDQLSLGNYSNLAQWVNTLDRQIEAILARRVEDAIRVWTLVFSQSEEVEELRERQVVLPHVKNVVVELCMTAQTLYISPSTRETREKILEQLYEWHSVCTAQTRISGKRFQMVMNEEIEPETYHNILNVMPEGQACLEKAYDCVNGIMMDLEEYLSEWLSYQSLWVLQSEQLFETLGTSLSKWMKTLMEIRKGRLVFDTQDTRKVIFPVTVEYGKAQQKILFKYDYWHKEMLVKFGAVVGDEMQKFFNSVSKWRNVLETQSVDGGSTSDTIGLISFVQSLKKQTKAGQDAVDLYRSSQRLLNQQRYQFPAQWLYSENVEGEWSAFAEILSLRDASIQTQMMNLQTKFAQEDELVEKRTGETLADWNKNKPVEGAQRPQDALNVITAYEAKLNKLSEERNKMRKARVALDLSDSAHAPSERDKLSVATEELAAMKEVWKALQPVYTGIDETKEKTWLSVQPRKIRQSLDELMNQLKQLPVKCRTYPSYEHVKTMLHTYGKMNALVADLKSEALKERHWHQMMKEMRVNWNLSDLTLGQVWDADILRHETTIRKILLVAQGEMALEEFLREMREYWQNYEVELVNYQNKTRLIKGWDDLFNKLKEHQNSLSAMKLSPYYKQFEESAQSWDEKLNKINAMFDVWIDVQRRWVYLEGLFSGSAEIATLLPFESSRFATITTDVLALMKKVSASPRILDVVNMQGAQRLLERLADMLAKIQKALGEYLERERSSFPRFYFVGDEDLLEIMGNSKDITRIQKHLKKMFAGITAIDINEEDRSITAFHSREGEKVNLVKIVTTKDVRINDWLQALESEMKHTLARQLASSLAHFSKMNIQTMTTEDYVQWLDNYPTQVITLTAEIWWCDEMEKTLADGKEAENVEQLVVKTLELLADSVLKEQPPIRRKKMEALITELVHKRDTCRKLTAKKIRAANDFGWLQCMRFYFDPKEIDPVRCCVVKMANAQFYYGFEYLGIQERLVRTPLTDRCYLTMTQALHSRLGGSPFGPAGTGKTESVKALGHQLGRFVLVFNCDETFDFQAMGRILVGLCQVGAWGCFDEFNRLEERMLSAVSQQIQTIQEAVRAGGDMSVDLVGKRLNVNSNIGIFITMNPGYSGRSNLPDNLKQLFRSLAMTQPDRQLIAQVMLFSQGFRTAETLANKIVPLFILCKEQLSAQCHYDFGLRALKYVLVSAGNIKRDKLDKMGSAALEDIAEQQMLIQSVCETLVPKLVNEDIALLFSLLSDVFPGIHYTANQMKELRQQLSTVCNEHLLVHNDVQGEMGSMWLDKVLQLYQITNLNHGLMLVGSSGSGKTMAWKVLLKALERWENVEGVAHVIDAKAMSKDALYGVMDPNTREWTDGLFTSIIRKIIDNVRGEADRRQWIIFDGDVDPEWVENLNSVLDDNKLLTLPNGERLSIPPNVRIIFEVADLKYATLATVSRCGMVWFSEEVVTSEMLFERYLSMIRRVPLDSESAVSFSSSNAPVNLVAEDAKPSRSIEIQRTAALALQTHFSQDGIVPGALKYAVAELEHIMPPTPQRLLSSFFSMMSYSIRKMVSHDEGLIDDSMELDQIQNFVLRSMLTNLVWAFSGDGKWRSREMMSDFIRQATTISLPPNQQACLIDYEVQLNGEWQPWLAKVPTMEIESHRVAAADLVVPTIDTVRHEMLLAAWLAEHKPLVLCGPPGSGKTMTLLAALRSQQEMDVVNVNFSSSTTPELLLRTFDHYCEYRRTPNGVVLAPVQMSQWLVIFCDEINLPAPDKYGTQRVISFLRQLVELNGFYRTSDHSWVSLERIQFVGACNPPTDPGRHPMTSRFLRHVPIVYVDYPGQTSLQQIYGTFNRAMLKMTPAVRGLADQLTNSMVDVYLASQEHFTQDDQPHYVYSPRELTRWVRGISEAITPLESLSAEQLVRLWAHEAIRLFQDRLVTQDERDWTDKLVDETAEKYFGNACRLDEALKRPLLYSCWLSRNYVPVTRDELQDYVSARLKGFYEEELDVKLVLFDQMLDHVLRIDRIYRQSQGHLLLIGTAGAGKTTLSRFVAWLNGLSVFQLKVHSKYTAADFDEDMRTVLRRAGCRNEKLCFIMDESNMLDTGFLERLNTLLANGEVPGLFEGDEHTTLMTQIKEGAQRQGLILDSHDELYKWFTQQVMRNLHVVFTMNPSGSGLRERASTSPALFNRCVLNWFGDWSDNALYQVGSELTRTMDLDRTDYEGSVHLTGSCDLIPSQPTYRDAVVNTLCLVHQTVKKFNDMEMKKGHRVMACTPRHFLDFIKQFMAVFHEKRSDLEEEKIHLNIGLNKISETEEQVEELQKSLHLKRKELEEKKEAANLKLKEMLGDQQKAEEEKKFSEQLQKELAEQLKQMAEKKTVVESDLAQVEPAVAEAQTAVQGIKKSQLVEVKSMSSPPVTVKLTLEAICILLGEQVGTDWKAIRQVMMKEDFMTRILQFDTESLTPQILSQMERYIQNPDWEFEKVNRASVACGPMVKWARAQLLYSTMLHKVEPLRNELKRLEKEAAKKTEEGKVVDVRITELEESIGKYKEEYAQLIGQAENIKQDLSSVQEKVNRSTQLLSSLRSERDRWSSGSAGFSQQMDSLVGDALLSSAFLAYAGYYDQMIRDEIFQKWFNHVVNAGLHFRHDLARIEYLSTVDDRLQWQLNSLPVDDLCTENAIMLHRFNRYPLIIDPSGQAVEYIMKQFSGKNIQKTSFLDDSFRKNLESALRFGNSLLVQDVEAYDPILNPVLNREVKRAGGRVLITIGDQDIDLSPSFQIFMITRDSTVEFSPDICSRVTFVNFTVTSSSLASQCLNQVLRSERPDVDKKRNDLLKLQGEFAVRLRHLEKALLAALNESKGKILDDNSVIETLERLKNEAAEVAQKSAETDKVMAEVDAVSAQYQRLATACSHVYHTLQQLNEIHFLYHYSLDFLVEIFTYVLKTPELSSTTDYAKRLRIITTSLFQTVFRRVSRGMLHTDKVLLALLLMRIHIRSNPAAPAYEQHFDLLLGRSDVVTKTEESESVIPSGLDFLSMDNKKAIAKTAKLNGFENVFAMLKSNAAAVTSWLTHDNPESNVPVIWEDTDNTLTPLCIAMNSMIVVHALRPDRLMASAHRVVSTAFDDHFMQQDKVVDILSIVDNEVAPSEPVLLCSATGYDASGKIEDLAVETSRQLTSIAIGSAEGFSQADSALAAATKSGRWVLLKNVHLAPSWLAQLEKRLHSMKPHAQFRLFLTAEIHPKLPSSIMRASRVVVFEPATGLKANLLRSLSSIPPQRLTKAPTERSRLYLLVCWLHALVQERLRYTPLGWSTAYEFSDADLRVACDTLDAAVDAVAQGRPNVEPERLPWTTLRTLLSQCIYGGKIDNEFDQVLLDCVLENLFTAKSFEQDHVLIPKYDGDEALFTPTMSKKDQMIGWVEELKNEQLPAWLGLPNNAEKVLLTKRGESMIRNMLKVTDEELACGEDGKEEAKPQWMAQLGELVKQWLQLLPKEIVKMRRTVENIKDPLFRFFEREVNLGSQLLKDIRRDLNEIAAVCRAEKKQNNETRALAASLQKGEVPNGWKRYTVPREVTVMDWMADLNERLKQLMRIGAADNLKRETFWLGGTFSPEAYITATRQQVAQANTWSLEQLNLHIHIGRTDNTDVFRISGVDIRGAKSIGGNKLELCELVKSECDVVELSWKQDAAEGTRLPLYLYGDRRQLISPLAFHLSSATVFYQRGVALVANTTL
ncbi:Protein CBR-DHC-1 [Caenorhabditis briggsae]|uniref:Dynein heavy chain, cytoplasmic n=2 Tax=Caenorhabditis briggsae TaxID=6238 RepID=A8XF10_CAEBR|nr:Protein CBR-DHC-1 [Caenorhabditis briggsae]ULU11966.1 hypothetical protein L3Y34_015371 [Caenorhabditis briggsae]CAP31232.1 Protein CBR-DHC-1 [Caenorhabditis briggsae]